MDENGAIGAEEDRRAGLQADGQSMDDDIPQQFRDVYRLIQEKTAKHLPEDELKPLCQEYLGIGEEEFVLQTDRDALVHRLLEKINDDPILSPEADGTGFSQEGDAEGGDCPQAGTSADEMTVSTDVSPGTEVLCVSTFLVSMTIKKTIDRMAAVYGAMKLSEARELFFRCAEVIEGGADPSCLGCLSDCIMNCIKEILARDDLRQTITALCGNNVEIVGDSLVSQRYASTDDFQLLSELQRGYPRWVPSHPGEFTSYSLRIEKCDFPEFNRFCSSLAQCGVDAEYARELAFRTIDFQRLLDASADDWLWELLDEKLEDFGLTEEQEALVAANCLALAATIRTPVRNGNYAVMPEEARVLLAKYSNPDIAVDVYRNVGRNDPCPCGSGKKYKKCCGSK